MTHPYGNLSIEQVKMWMQNLLKSSDRAVCRAILVIYERQTASEKEAKVTVQCNNIGFSGVDAEILSSFAEQYMKRGWLSEKQMVIARKKMLRYWKQLADISRDNGKLPVSLPAVPKQYIQLSQESR